MQRRKFHLSDICLDIYLDIYFYLYLFNIYFTKSLNTTIYFLSYISKDILKYLPIEIYIVDYDLIGIIYFWPYRFY